ncbi:rubrerythrin-like domain-containing protein [Haloterrigena sp. SYSU A558-1]|uniref:Rubrerythrin-like domain-containing protein n=2 Tax=Haloterrigena gelatinilytica TaxID=2741724 RepID=A0A8J8KFS8_9EURY|nr:MULTISPECIES: rubrerythrin-like domain-containing protein [Haloterrigena]NUB91886.1 rubrerythrin-like domain-containing protein [Haloterrigena gelatinilytica]NUC72289.1 rubrerythrin-like domain-containing protein [Haloterrigena gelatinilytica]
MVHPAPRAPERSYYECCECGYREMTDSLESCPECDGRTRNIAVARA